MINLDINRPIRDFEVKSSGSNRIACEDTWVCLDPYDLDGVLIEEIDGVLTVSHVHGDKKDIVFSARIEEP